MGSHRTAPGTIRLYLRIRLLLEAELLGLHQAVAHAVQPHVPAHPKTLVSQVPGWKRRGEAPSSPRTGTGVGSAPPGTVGWPRFQPSLGLDHRGLNLEGERGVWGAKPKNKLGINWVTLPSVEAEGSSLWHGKGGRRGPGLPPSPYLLSAPVLTSILARSGKRKVGGRKTCRDKRTFSYCTSTSRKGAWRGDRMAALRAETLTRGSLALGATLHPGRYVVPQ